MRKGELGNNVLAPIKMFLQHEHLAKTKSGRKENKIILISDKQKAVGSK